MRALSSARIVKCTVTGTAPEPERTPTGTPELEIVTLSLESLGLTLVLFGIARLAYQDRVSDRLTIVG